MKISEFASKFNVSHDTVRYYMELNLILPERKGGHYYFDEKCQSQMEEILKLKKMAFSLQEIKKILNFKRIGKLSTYQQNNYYQNLFKNKLREIESGIAELIDAREKIKIEIDNLKLKQKHNNITIGIDLSALKLFSCPNCNNDLLLSAKNVEANQVLDGSLICSCGKILKIKDGILFCHNLDNEIKKIEENHIEEYIKSTDQDFIDKAYENLEWMHRQLELKSLSGKVIMEPGSGFGHFLRQIYDNLPDDSIYICIDNNPWINQYLKQLLEMTGKRKKIIFISANLPELPLKTNIIDLLIDFTGTSCYSFENVAFLPELLDPYLKKQTIFLATFIIYHKFGPKNIVPKPYRKNFIYNNIKEKLLKLDFKLEKENKLEYQTIKKSMGKYENFAQPGDQIFSFQVKAKRWS